MKHILFVLVASLFVSTMATAQDVAQVYRSFDGRQHYMATDPYEGQSYGYTLEGPTFRVYTQRVDDDLRPLWKCIYTPQNQQFISIDRNCEGWARQGRLGYVSTQNYPGHAAVYRCYFSNGYWQDHLTTTDYWECTRGGYRVDAIIGYAPDFR